MRDCYWAYDGRRLVSLQDSGGDGNWRLHAVDVRTGDARLLTPEGVHAIPAGGSRRIRGEVLVSLNRRASRTKGTASCGRRTAWPLPPCPRASSPAAWAAGPTTAEERAATSMQALEGAELIEGLPA